VQQGNRRTVTVFVAAAPKFDDLASMNQRALR